MLPLFTPGLVGAVTLSRAPCTGRRISLPAMGTSKPCVVKGRRPKRSHLQGRSQRIVLTRPMWRQARPHQRMTCRRHSALPAQPRAPAWTVPTLTQDDLLDSLGAVNWDEHTQILEGSSFDLMDALASPSRVAIEDGSETTAATHAMWSTTAPTVVPLDPFPLWLHLPRQDTSLEKATVAVVRQRLPQPRR